MALAASEWGFALLSSSQQSLMRRRVIRVEAVSVSNDSMPKLAMREKARKQHD
jgi:hypothetical protein